MGETGPPVFAPFSRFGSRPDRVPVFSLVTVPDFAGLDAEVIEAAFGE